MLKLIGAGPGGISPRCRELHKLVKKKLPCRILKYVTSRILLTYYSNDHISRRDYLMKQGKPKTSVLLDNVG